jgi:hypothetical protein
MTGVRNGPLARLRTSSGDPVGLGTVPAGMTWLVKTIHVLNVGTAAIDLVVQLSNPDGSVYVRLPPFAAAAGEAMTWEGWTALGPGDQLTVLNGPEAMVWVAGAELPGVIA